MNKALSITSSPHIHSKDSTGKIMWSVVICLIPSGIWGVYNFGWQAFGVIIVSVLSALLTEIIITKIQGKLTVFDGSAFLTGLLIAYNMPPSIPAFIPVVASVFAIAVVKHTFGGLGRNWMNPALAGRVFVVFCWTEEMTSWSPPASFTADVFTGATPISQGAEEFLKSYSYLDLFIGNISGCIGEVSALLLLAGTIYLFIKKYITWEIPVSYILSFSLFIWIFGDIRHSGKLFSGDILFHLLSGGLVLGAFYMATDMVTSPLMWKGMLIFGVGCGFLTFIIRIFGGFPEGVSLAIILMNIFVPLINKFIKPVKFGSITEKIK